MMGNVSEEMPWQNPATPAERTATTDARETTLGQAPAAVAGFLDAACANARDGEAQNRGMGGIREVIAIQVKGSRSDLGPVNRFPSNAVVEH